MDISYAPYTDTNKDRVVITDGTDPDGFGAAVAAWMRFGDDATYTFYKHGGDIDDVKSLVEGKEVIFSDLSLDYKFLNGVASLADNVLVIDHHDTSKDGYDRLYQEHDNVEIVYDEHQSAAHLAWRTFHREEPPPLFKYVQDYDLWLFDQPNSREINACIDTLPNEFHAWEPYVHMSRETLEDEFLERGEGMIDYEEHILEDIADQKQIIDWEGYRTAFVNNGSYELNSMLGNHILQHDDETVDVVFLWMYSASKSEDAGKPIAKVSLRARETDPIHVGEIASQYGGGGHAPAAGMQMPMHDLHAILQKSVD